MPTEIFQQLLRSRLALVLTAGGLVGLLAAAIVRLIPWGLFLLTVVLGVVGAVVYGFVLQWWARRKDAFFEQGINAQGLRALGGARVRDRENVKALQSQWKDQVEALRRSRIGRQKRWLYFLPWYAIIGAPASGKSTAIKNSGLRFPMGEPKLSGTGGTKNCDWWFSEEAIILDTAGRYTFSDENEPDRDEWLEFLRLLRKYRPVAPINGLIVAVSADTLVAREPDDVVEDARAMRHKLDQLVGELGIQFPVYLLITKCDLVEGFTEYFGRLPRRRLDEMLGWTNPSWEMTEPRKLVADALGALHARVTSLRPGFLWEEERAEQLRAIYLFPEEMRGFAKNLEEFCDVLFRETQYNESPFLRGIYLTSGLQKGTAVSRMLQRLGLRAKATELREEKRSYFLKDFFHIRLPADRSLVATTGRRRGRLQVFHNLALATVATACVLLAVLTGGSYVANRTLLNDLQDEMEAASVKEGTAPTDKVDALARYVGVIDRLEDRNRRRPTSAGWGLWTGYRAIEPARRLFLARFERDAYLPGVEVARRLLRARDPERGFGALEALVRNYVLSKMLNGTNQEAPGANDALAVFWADGRETPEALLESYGRGYLAYLRWRPAEMAHAEQANDLVLIRETLPEMFTVERVATWANRLYPPLRAVEIPVSAAIANGAAVQGAFRPEAWTERVGPLTDAVEEVAPEIDPQLTSRFREEYQRRYYSEWMTFLSQPKVGGDGQTAVSTLLGEQSPYIAIVGRVADATGTFEGGGERPAWVKTVGRVSGERAAYLGQLAAMEKQLRAGRADPAAALDDVRGIFTRRVAVTVEDGAEPPADPFGKAERYVQSLVNKGQPADDEDARVRARVEEMLVAPVYTAFADYLQTAAQEIDVQWRRRIGEMRAESCGDIRALYGTGGVVPEFVNAVLAPFFDPGGFHPKVRYRNALARSMDWYPPMQDKMRRRCAGDGGGGGGGGGGSGGADEARLFFTAVPSTPGEGGVYATRTTLTVWCGDEPWQIEHRNFPAAKQLTWSSQTCSRAEVAVSVGRDASDERALPPRAAESLPGLIRQAEELGSGQVGWKFPGGVTARFKVALPAGFLEGTAGMRPPAQLPKS